MSKICFFFSHKICLWVMQRLTLLKIYGVRKLQAVFCSNIFHFSFSFGQIFLIYCSFWILAIDICHYLKGK